MQKVVGPHAHELIKIAFQRKEHEMASSPTPITKRPGIEPLTKRKAWKALQAHHSKVSKLHLRQLFAEDPKRGERMTAEAAGLFLDYSKNRITDQTLKLLIQLAEKSDLREHIEAMFRGDKINITENRAVLHVALRAPKGASTSLTARMWFLKCTLCSTRWRTFRIVSAPEMEVTPASASATQNIGIGGSDLGPVMAYEALGITAARTDVSIRFKRRWH